MIEGRKGACGGDDTDAAQSCMVSPARQGIDIVEGADGSRNCQGRAGALEGAGQGVAPSLLAPHLLIAVGRKPNTDTLGSGPGGRKNMTAMA